MSPPKTSRGGKAKAQTKSASGLWGGRFETGLDPTFEAFNRSLGVDKRLVQMDIQGSIAWADAIAKAGVLTAAENRKLAAALRKLGREVAQQPELLEGQPDEDVHGYVERRLTEALGSLGKKLHTGRSRNDQVATDLKLYLREQAGRLNRCMESLIAALVELAEQSAALPMPGYTHLQRAQPITIGHHALAYVEMLGRDRERIQDALDRMDVCPLGSGALAGSAFDIDRAELSRHLGFAGGPTRNSIDAVSDRDHACELVFSASMCMLHLSRLAEDWIFFASQEAGMLEFNDAVATGSSLMPQKKNPDAMELLRGKCGRVVGDLNTLLVTLKSLPLAYDKDLQEDKEATFDALDTLEACLRVAAIAVRNVRFQRAACEAAASSGYLNATDLADLLVAAGVPFRDAHERTGLCVREALALGLELENLPDELCKQLLPELGSAWKRELSVERVLNRRRCIGGTAPKRVRSEVGRWKKKLSKWNS